MQEEGKYSTQQGGRRRETGRGNAESWRGKGSEGQSSRRIENWDDVWTGGRRVVVAPCGSLSAFFFWSSSPVVFAASWLAVGEVFFLFSNRISSSRSKQAVSVSVSRSTILFDAALHYCILLFSALTSSSQSRQALVFSGRHHGGMAPQRS